MGVSWRQCCERWTGYRERRGMPGGVRGGGPGLALRFRFFTVFLGWWMPAYRRNRSEGGTYFFTVTLLDRPSCLLVDEVAALRGVVGEVGRVMPFHVDAWVVLPEHMHCVWTLPEGDARYSELWARIKSGFSRLSVRPEFVSARRRAKRERAVWGRRFWEHTVRDEADYARCVDYTHFNPFKWAGDAWVGWVRRGLAVFVVSVVRGAGVYAAAWVMGRTGPGRGIRLSRCRVRETRPGGVKGRGRESSHGALLAGEHRSPYR
jgi:putative transposase